MTGAASGIGRRIAEDLVNSGAHVIAVDRDAQGLQFWSGESNVRTFQCDLSDTAATEQAFDGLEEVDFLVNAAGIAIFEPILELSASTWDVTTAVNCRAPVLLTQSFARQCIARGVGGAVVNISSQSSTIAVSDNHLAYSASKAMMDQITRGSAVSLAPHGIRVNAVRPTVVRTELAMKAHGEEGFQRLAQKIPLGRVAEPSDVSSVVLYLLSDGAGMITGESVRVDGGFVVDKKA